MLENGACALHVGALAFHVEFESSGPRIPSRELLPLLPVPFFYGRFLSGLSFCFETDSLGVFSAINRGVTSEVELQPLVRWLGRLSRDFSIEVTAAWCPREANGFADKMSRVPRAQLVEVVAAAWLDVASDV